MELGQEGWLKQLVAKVRGPIMAGDQGSHWGHQCSETTLTGDTSSRSVGASLGCETLPPGREANSWLTGPVRLCSGVRLQELHSTGHLRRKKILNNAII